jgi:uncharacterized protein YejL (UPF0352 family)
LIRFCAGIAKSVGCTQINSINRRFARALASM